MIELAALRKVYRASGREVVALDEVSLRIEAGSFVALRGSSGSGKTSLLMTLGGMQRPTSGRVTIDGRDLYALDARERAAFRAARIGFVFQMFHLVEYLDVLDNVLLGGRVGGVDRDRALQLLKQLGMSHRVHHKPGELSTGERQRAAIARAMMNQPPLILADEPTGNLDEDNARAVVEILRDYHLQGATVVMVTHGDAAADIATRRIEMKHGRVVADTAASQGSEGKTIAAKETA